MDLDIHLDRSDAVPGTCHLEVHIAEEIFQPLDIRQNDVIVVGLPGHQTAGNTRHRFFDSTPAAIRDILDAQILAWEVDPLDSKVSDTVRIA